MGLEVSIAFGKPMATEGRPETEVKKIKKPKAGLRNIDKGLHGKLFLPTPDFGLPTLTTRVPL